MKRWLKNLLAITGIFSLGIGLFFLFLPYGVYLEYHIKFNPKQAWAFVATKAPIEYAIDISEPDQGVTGNGRSIKAFVDAIGVTRKATIKVLHTEITTFSTYTVTTNETITDNIASDVDHGAILDGAGTLTINGPFEARLTQCFGLSITITFGSGAVKEVLANWGGNTLAGFNKMSAAIANNSKLIVAPGSYSFAGTWTFSSKNDIEIIGHSATITETSNTTKLLSLTSCNRVKIKGFRLVGKGTDFDNSQHTNAKGIYLEGCDDVTIRDNTIYNFGNSGIWWTTTTNVKITENTIEGPGIAEIAAADNYCFGLVGYADGNSYGTAFIQGNEISEAATGILTSEGHHNLKITDNIIKNMRGQHGIYLSPADNISITDNIIENPEQIGIKIQLSTTHSRNYENIHIANNTIRDSGQVAIIVVILAGSTHTLDTVTVSDNTLQNCGEGIHVRGIASYLISNYNISDNNISTTTSGFGIMATRSYGSIQNNRIDSSYKTAIYAYVDTGKITDIIDNVADNIVQDGTAADDDAIGIYLYGAGTINLKGNTVRQGTGSADSALRTSNEPTLNSYNNIWTRTLGEHTQVKSQISEYHNLDALSATTSDMAGHETFTYLDHILVRDPDGAARNMNPSGNFQNGHKITLINTADAAETITFDSAGLNQAVAQNERGIFVFDGTDWRKVYVGS